ncbi:hypothetical protein [Nitratireductor sp. StC3]|uniref:hypothetical protein n=1 Tax=Nitratireductor sp. StC3 TaxID=2126741 RepID=UPI000D0DD18D|nr:hypothetical protein [Nitratireductor sp. StC3]PSM16681.1 hypothetical protein C7T96_18560 [Nitratireductor sp. StC3]
MRRKLVRLSAEYRNATTVVSMIVAGVSGFLSFISYREFLADTIQPPAFAAFAAFGIACACGALLHLIFILVLGGIPYVQKRLRHGFIPMIATLMVLVAMFSTYTNVLATGGGSALAIHAARHIDALMDVAGDLQALALEAGQLAPDLSDRAARLRAQADCERSEGCRTGSPGAGALTDALSNAADRIADSAKVLSSSQAAIMARIPELNAAFANGNDIAARSLLALLRSRVPVAVLRSAAADLRQSLGIRGTARGAALRQRQDDGIDALQGELANVADALEVMAGKLEDRLAALVLPDRHSLTKAGAILKHADQLVPQIAVGIAIDWVLILVAFLMGQFRDATPPPEDDVSDISLADARRASRETARLAAEVYLRDEDFACPFNPSFHSGTKH